jgi:hypothetical protein
VAAPDAPVAGVVAHKAKLKYHAPPHPAGISATCPVFGMIQDIAGAAVRRANHLQGQTASS